MKKNIKILGLFLLLSLLFGGVNALNLPDGFDSVGELKLYIQNFIGTPEELGVVLNNTCSNQFDQKEVLTSYSVFDKINGIWLSPFNSYEKALSIEGGYSSPIDYIVIVKEQKKIKANPYIFYRQNLSNLEKLKYNCYSRYAINITKITYDGTYNTIITSVTSGKTATSVYSGVFAPIVNWTSKEVKHQGNNGQYFTAWLTTFPLS